MRHGLTRGRWLAVLAVYLVPFLLCMVVLPFIGPSREDLAGPGTAPDAEADAFILHELRLPRVALALLAGGALAMTGACFQVILRNPLAEPFTLGVTGGAAVGAVLALSVSWLALDFGILSTVQIFALLGAGAVMLIVYTLARRPQGISMSVLLLAGVTLSILCGGLVLFIRYLADPYSLLSMDRWLMGGLAGTMGFNDLLKLAPFMMLGLLVLLPQLPALNHLAMGEGLAAGHGVDVARVQRRIFLGGSLLTAGVVSLTGPIGFVGLIVAHAVRRLSGFDQRIVVPASFLLGGTFLAVCDTVGRVMLTGRDMPVGVITALIGGPIFIRILLGRRR